MGTNVTKLKSSKGPPPKAENTTDVIAEDSRETHPPMKPIQFRVPIAIFEEFSERAGREFGFNKGAKSNLFLRVWQSYKER